MSEVMPPNGDSSKRRILFKNFLGCDTHASRTKIGKQKFAFLENLQPIGFGNLKTVPAPKAIVYVSDSGVSPVPPPPPCPTVCGLTVCPALIFGCVTQGVESAAKVATITNTYSVARTVSNIISSDPQFHLSGFPALPFTMAAGGTQGINATVIAGAGPLIVGNIIITSDADSSPDYVSMTALVCAAAAKLAVFPTPVALQVPSPYCSRDSKPFFAANVGNTTLHVSGISIPGGTHFGLSSVYTITHLDGSSFTSSAPFTLLAGDIAAGSTSFDTEVGGGGLSTTITINSDAPSSPDTISVSATIASPPTLCCPSGTPISVNFDFVNVGNNAVIIDSVDAPCPYNANLNGGGNAIPVGCRGSDGVSTVNVVFDCRGCSTAQTLTVTYHANGNATSKTATILLSGSQVAC
jgi:hypothetical protein